MNWLNLRRATTIACCFALLALVGSTAALAGQISYFDTVSFPLSPGSDTAVIPQWDPALFPGQTLVSVELEIDATVGAGVTAENDSAIAGNMGVSLTGIVNASGPSGLSATAVILTSAGPVAVAATDGVGGSGPDYHDFGLLSANDIDTDIIALLLGPYQGNLTINIPVNGSGGFAVSGVTSSTIQVTNFGGSGTVTVTYNYVPEPGSIVLALMGACGVALSVWRRRRK